MSPISSSPRKAVVIDDDPLVCEFVHTVLSAIGFEVFAELTGERGVERIRELAPALVVVDMRLPGIDGLEVIRTVGALPMPLPTIVGMSAAWAETEKQAIARGAVAFLRKPLRADIVVGTVEKALGGRFVWIEA